MGIIPLLTNCEQAALTHFRLEIEASEIESLAPNPDALTDDLQNGSVRLQGRQRTFRLGERFFQTALQDCETCDTYDPENPDPCPNKDVLGFITDTLTK
jgi:hypothetical protein